MQHMSPLSASSMPKMLLLAQENLKEKDESLDTHEEKFQNE